MIPLILWIALLIYFLRDDNYHAVSASWMVTTSWMITRNWRISLWLNHRYWCSIYEDIEAKGRHIFVESQNRAFFLSNQQYYLTVIVNNPLFLRWEARITEKRIFMTLCWSTMILDLHTNLSCFCSYNSNTVLLKLLSS